ncbi:MAG: sigma 54-interacting transcriptional regulator [Deltaproteobacteria bacterium]|nr:sigma 54-interacting transcriptional regulator [Deltaproteobacteria bacterium]
MQTTIDDVSVAGPRDAPEPGIAIVASDRTPMAHVLALGGGPADLGRTTSAGGTTIDIADDRMSRDHATVRRERDGWVVVDRDSRNGTFANGERVTGELRRRGDVVVRLGYTIFVLIEDIRGHRGGRAAVAPDAHVVGPELARAFEDIDRGAGADALLVHGESGSGKELAARRFHAAGPRKAGPFVPVNCAAIPEGVAERLLFGAKKGAFSGAIDAFGYFQQADGGTLFLDEIADLDPAVQAKLLRALEGREIVPVGASSPVKVDVGIVAASHRELRGAVADGRFRDDLYYRLARVTVRLPPLRERKIDLARLVQREVAAQQLAAHPKLLEACLLRPWPGNVRELVAALREAAGRARTSGRDVVRPEDLGDDAGQPIGGAQPETMLERPNKPAPEFDRATIEAALARANQVISVAARALGLHRTQLYRLMEKHGISRVDT